MKYLGTVSKADALAQPTNIYTPIRDGKICIISHYVESANIVSVDGYIVKNRYGSDTKVPENHISGNYFEIFWDEERKILKLCSKKSLREEKLKKILE